MSGKGHFWKSFSFRYLQNLKNKNSENKIVVTRWSLNSTMSTVDENKKAKLKQSYYKLINIFHSHSQSKKKKCSIILVSMYYIVQTKIFFKLLKIYFQKLGDHYPGICVTEYSST